MKNWRIYENLALVTQIGVTLAVYIIGAVVIGGYLDDKFSTSPLFLVALLILSISAAFMNLYRMMMKVASRKGEKDKWKK